MPSRPLPVNSDGYWAVISSGIVFGTFLLEVRLFPVRPSSRVERDSSRNPFWSLRPPARRADRDADDRPIRPVRPNRPTN
eukprot:30052-Pelagococcus_subviridis.AAC.2